jgi:hypothetical protein
MERTYPREEAFGDRDVGDGHKRSKDGIRGVGETISKCRSASPVHAHDRSRYFLSLPTILVKAFCAWILRIAIDTCRLASTPC